ncbi:hypothetical protein ACIGHN_02310 [Acidovorax sp. NPDC077693]|uniref:hypothetical protein n=1 Tax=unclassified Acidovorax TaxID=2684926 RepID=UPI0037C75AF5
MKSNIIIPITLSPEEALRKAAIHLDDSRGKVVATLDKQLDDVELLILVVRLTKKMIDRSELFVFQCTDFDFARAGESTLEKRLTLKVLGEPASNLLDLFEKHQLHPLLKIFVKAFQMHQLLGLDVGAYMYAKPSSRAVPVTGFMAPASELAWRLNQAVAKVREEAIKSNWKRLEKNFRRNANKNARNLILDLKAQLAAHARVSIIRLDLSFSNGAGVEPKHGKSNGEFSTEEEGQGPVYKKVRELRIAFWKEVEKAYGTGLLGRASKLEYGYSRGYHFHVLIFLDGSKHQQDIRNGIRIGEIWKRLVPDGEGAFYLCNVYKEKYKYLGLGMATYSDDGFFTGYVMAVAYLTKPDCYMQVILPGRDRAFHRTFTQEESIKKLGRKRRKGGQSLIGCENS